MFVRVNRVSRTDPQPKLNLCPFAIFCLYGIRHDRIGAKYTFVSLLVGDASGKLRTFRLITGLTRPSLQRSGRYLAVEEVAEAAAVAELCGCSDRFEHVKAFLLENPVCRIEPDLFQSKIDSGLDVVNEITLVGSQYMPPNDPPKVAPIGSKIRSFNSNLLIHPDTICFSCTRQMSISVAGRDYDSAPSKPVGWTV